MHITDTQKLEHMLEELYALDGSLKAHDADIRALVAGLLEARLIAPLDQAFVASLRERVVRSGVSQSAAPVSTKHREPAPHNWFWWLLRIAPAGVLAILVLALSGSRPQLPAPRGTVSEREVVQPTHEAQEEQLPTAPRTFPVGDVVGSTQTHIGAQPALTTEAPAGSANLKTNADTSLMATVSTGNSFDIHTQSPGKAIVVSFITLNAPGFVQVFVYKNETVGASLGSSALIPAGSFTQVPITLSRPALDGEILYARLLADNGDGVPDARTDPPVTDSLGNSMYTTFSIDRDAEPPSAVLPL